VFFAASRFRYLILVLALLQAIQTNALPSTPPSRAENGKSEKLIALRRQVRQTPKSAAAHLELGIGLSDAGMWDEARAEFQAAIKLHPEDPVATYNLGLNELRAAQSAQNGAPATYYALLDSAQKLLLQAAQLDPNLPSLHLHLGRLYHQAGDQESAIEEFHKAVATEPNSAEAYNNLGSALADVEKYEDALAVYRRAFTLDPGSASIVINLDGALRRAGKVKDLREEMQSALKKGTVSSSAYLLYGVALYWDGEKDGAMEQFDQVIKEEPAWVVVHYYRGEILREKGQMGGAEQEYAQAVQLAPDRVDFAVRYATTLSEAGKLKESAAILKSVVEAKPDDAALHFQLGRLLQRLQQKEAAARELQKAARLKQQAHVQGQLAMSLVEGIRQLRANHVAQAIEQFRAALAIDPNHPEANFYLGIALSQTGDVSGSTQAFDVALRSRPSSAEIHYNFGIALWQHQQASRAIEEFRKAVYLRSDYGLAHCALGLALLRSGAREEGSQEVEAGRKLGACGGTAAN
jgi:Flp pilus assembly protein TadD